jgi:hypothetical protein
MRTFTAAVGLIGILASHAALADESAPGGPPPSYGDSAATTPPPAESAPPAVTEPQPRRSSRWGAASAPALSGPSLWGILPWGGFGVGARFMFPLSFPPLLSRTPFRDSWALEAGADLLYWNYSYIANSSYTWTEIVPVVGVMWNVWFTNDFAAYPKVEVGYAFGWYGGINGSSAGYPTHGGIFPEGAAGVLYKLSGGLTLRGEVGYAGAKVGLGWLF